MKAHTKELTVAWQICLVFLASAAAIMLPDFAFATDTPMGNVMCTVVTWFTGNTGKFLGTLAVSILGIGALLGKISWGMTMVAGIGVAILFGAAGIVNAMNAGASTACVTS
jgi:type IV secretory pathway VirB2 component (pilin)